MRHMLNTNLGSFGVFSFQGPAMSNILSTKASGFSFASAFSNGCGGKEKRVNDGSNFDHDVFVLFSYTCRRER